MWFTILLLIPSAAMAQEILRPADQTSVKPGPLSVVVKASPSAQLTVDGAPVPLRGEGPGAMSAQIKVAAGKHTLILKDGGVEKRVEFMGGTGLPEFRVHPPATTCDTCHAVKDGAWSFKSIVLSDSCFTCHDSGKFPTAHTHVPEILPDCQLCHQPHGSAAAKHLKMKKEVACKQCHG
jgi:predicted CXXCH cytochrome family protein